MALLPLIVPRAAIRNASVEGAKMVGTVVSKVVSKSACVAALVCALALSAGLAATTAWAQQPPPAPAPAAAPSPAPVPPYGPAITLDQAKRVMSAAELEAAKNSWTVAITILDSGGNLVMFHKFDNAQLSAITTSEGKARTALEFKLPSKALDDAIAAGGAGLRLLALKDITPLQGGLLILADGKIVGAIGVSGALSSQDEQVAKTGADVLAKGM
jgi:glc operon protein GlcG